MSAQGPVLRDIHVPPAPWWPPAPGWWLLAALAVVVAACIVWWLWRRTQGRPLRAVLREIDAMELAYSSDGDDARLADEASRLLRRVARRVAPSVASSDGEAWRTFVHANARDAATREALGEMLAARFRAHPVLEAPKLFAALRVWCRCALRQAPPRLPNAARLSPAPRRNEDRSGGMPGNGSVRSGPYVRPS